MAPEVAKPAPDFSGTAVVKGAFKTIKKQDYKGKYLVLFFYPLDFTFVCPTEIIAFNDRVEEFLKINCEIVVCSTDSHFSHLAWINTPRKEGGIGSMKIPILADKNGQIASDYNVYKRDMGVAFRGLFIIDDQGILRQITVNDLPVGRSVDETLRLVQAFQYADAHGEMEKPLCYPFMLSLEHLALVKIVTALWKRDDISRLISYYNGGEISGAMCIEHSIYNIADIECRVRDRVAMLSLAEYFKEQLLGVIRPIGLEIFHWWKYHKETFHLNVLPLVFFWTSQGTIDKTKMAKELIKDGNLFIGDRYKLACIYCLEKDIPVLWNEIPLFHRKRFYDVPHQSTYENEDRLVGFWTLFQRKGKGPKMKKFVEKDCPNCSFYCSAFIYAAFVGSRPATAYFFEKLTLEEKDKALVDVSIALPMQHEFANQNEDGPPREYYADVLCFLLVHLDKQQQIKLFGDKYFEYMLKCFLDWPWQRFFKLTVQAMSRYMYFEHLDCYKLLAQHITRKVENGFQDYNYQELFDIMLERMPNAYKESVTKSLSEYMPVGHNHKIGTPVRRPLIETHYFVCCPCFTWHVERPEYRGPPELPKVSRIIKTRPGI